MTNGYGRGRGWGHSPAVYPWSHRAPVCTAPLANAAARPSQQGTWEGFGARLRGGESSGMVGPEGRAAPTGPAQGRRHLRAADVPVSSA